MTIHRPERQAPARQRELKREKPALQIKAGKAKVTAQLHVQGDSK